MLESLRARLLLWYSAVLTVLIVLYAAAVTYLYSQSLLGDIDADLAATSRVIAESVTPDISGTFDLNLPPQFRDTAFGDGPGATYYIVWNQQGDLVDRSEAAPDLPWNGPAGVTAREGVRELVSEGPGGARILVGRELGTFRAAVNSLGLRVAATGGLVLLLSFAGGSFLAGRALAPVARISRTAGAMVGGDLDARIPVKDTDSELEQVARALNEAFDRMRTATLQQRQFTADASHEFRTPLATLRAEFDWALKTPRSAADYRASIVKASNAVNRLTDIADRLLNLARAEHRDGTVRRDVVDMAGVAADVVHLLTPLAQSRAITITTALHPATVSGDKSQLADALSNLVKNAIEYNREQGSVAVSVSETGGGVVVTVRDTGVGISADDVPRIFDRFYRADRSRNRQVGGAGLGLAIAKKIVEEHGGAIVCNSEPGTGTEFLITLPAARAVAV